MNKHEAKASERFDQWADSYGDDRISAWFAHFQSKVIEMLRVDEEARVLDVGCGPGAAVRKAALRVPRGEAVGLDISPKMVAKAQSLSEGIANTSFHVGSSSNLPFERNSFDALTCTFSFHHYEQPEVFLAEALRVLKPEGQLLLLDSARDVSMAIWLQDRFRRYLERSHVRYLTTTELTALLEAARFQLLEPLLTFKGMFEHGKMFTGAMLASCVPVPREA